MNRGSAWRFSVDVKYEIQGLALLCASAGGARQYDILEDADGRMVRMGDSGT